MEERSQRSRGWQAVLLLVLGLVAIRCAIFDAFVGAPLRENPVNLFKIGDGSSLLPRKADPNQWTMLRDASGKQMPKKPPYISINLLNKVTRMNKEGNKDTIRVYSRQSTIIPAMIGHTCAVHNGRDFVPIKIDDGMVGFKIGDFVPTHTFTSHPKQAKVTKYRGR
ncbi:unnamed protein product [Durusdinium trenchii]|uniref:Small ribosomal subunit protein uS19c n=1 Tax=Durusdinium trenchii TaxID=1381693 RepID=A0ABP0H9Z3_9DINO